MDQTSPAPQRAVPVLLADLRQQGIELWSDGAVLRYSAPPGGLAPALRAELAARKPELLDWMARAQTPARQGLPAAPAGPAPLTFAQERLWFLDQLEPGSPSLNTLTAYRLEGRLDVSALQRSLDTIAARHASLRTTFALRDGTPVQWVSPPGSAPLECLVLPALAAEEAAARVTALVDEYADWSFDLAAAPPWAARLVTLAPDDHLLLLAFHHTIFDGWSLGVLARELSACYAAYSTGQMPDLPVLPVDYAGYAVWQRADFQQERLAGDMGYWRQQLAGRPALSSLPPDRTPAAASGRRGAVVSATLPARVQASLKALCQQENVTAFMALLAVFDLLLFRRTDQADLVVGAPVAGRDRVEVERLVGVFINNLALRVDLSGDPTFRELLQRVRGVALAAFAHQAVPFERLLAELEPERSLSHTPLFQCCLNVLTSDQAPLTLAGLRLTRLYASVPAAHFDVTLYVRTVDGRLSLRLVYNADLFEGEQMEALLDQFVGLLEQVVAQPGQPLAAYSLVTATARAALPDPAARLDDTWHGPIQARLTQLARLQPKQLAIVDPHAAWTYAALETRTNQLAHALVAAGVQRGEVVAIYAQRGAALVWAVLGALKAGAAFLILDPAYPAGRLADYLTLAQPRGLIVLEAAGALPEAVQQVVAGLALRGQWSLPAVPDERWDKFASTPLTLELGPDDLAYVSFTSGSTGRPKGVLGRHGPLTHFLPWQAATMALTAGDRFSLLSGLAHDPLQRDIFTALWVGGTLYAPAHDAQFVPGQLADWLAETGITVAHLTPPLSRLIADTAAANLRVPGLRWVFFVGDKLTRPDVLRLRALAPNVTCLNSYGATETQRAVGYYRVPPAATDIGRAVYPLGQGMPGAQLLVLNAHQQLCGPGELGEIYVRSPHLAAGYLGDAALTEARFLTNPFINDPHDRLYRTGDLGRYRADGQVEFAGRADRQVKVRGYRIEPGEIEAMVRTHPAVREAAVLVREVGADEAVLTAYVAGAVAVADLRDWLQQRLPDFMLPARLVVLPALPLTPNGKLDTAALPAPEAEPAPAAGQPRSPVEETLAGIWGTLLDRPVGVHDNFFALGGHSLLAIRMLSQIEAAWGQRVPVTVLFEAPTIAQLARVLGQARPAPDRWPTVVAIQPHGPRGAFFCVHGFGGGVLDYADLAYHLGDDQPFYALQALGFDGRQPPHETVEAMAAHYVEAIQATQPQGPYHLGGYCFGGVVAFEVARQLRARDAVVGLVAIFEGYAPPRSRAGESRWHPRQWLHLARNLPYWLHDYWQLGYAGMWHGARQRVGRLWRRRVQRRPVQVEDVVAHAVQVPAHHRRLMELHLRATRDYLPAPYEGPVTLFNVPSQSLLHGPDPLRGWGRLARGGVVVRRVAGSHSTLLKPPHVRVLAEALRTGLDAAEAAPTAHANGQAQSA